MLLSKRLMAPDVAAVSQFALPASTVLAHSVARAFDGYTGDLIRVRRSSDNVEADIGSDGSGNLDEAALLAHTGSSAGNHGYITKVYEQSGATSAVDFVQSTTGDQPQIVLDGVVLKANGRPTGKAQGLSTHLISETWTPTSRPNPGAVIQVMSIRTSPTQPIPLSTSGNSAWSGIMQSGSTRTDLVKSAGAVSFRKNGTLIGATGSISRGLMWDTYGGQGLLVMTHDNIGMAISNYELLTTFHSTTYPGGEEFSEQIVLDAAGSTDVSDVEDDQITYYGIT